MWPKPKKEKQESYPIIMKRKKHSLNEQRRVIWLRYASLESNEVIWHTSTQVKDITGIGCSSQRAIIKRWISRGFKVLSLLSLTGARIKIDMDTRAMIASPSMLMEQRHLSLE